MILGICDNVTTLKVIQIVRTVITIIKIVVPLILIISMMIEGVRTIANKDAEVGELLKKFSTKIIAALLIFFIPTFVNIIANTVSADTSELAKCIQNSTSQGISNAEVEQANKYITRAKETLSSSDYSVAFSNVNNIKDQNNKNLLMGKLNVVKYYVELKNQISELANKYDSSKATSLYTKINAIQDSEVKTKLLKMLEDAGIGKPLNVAAGTYLKSFEGTKYYVVIPEGATTKMPLITYLVGGNPHSTFANPEGAIMKSQPTKAVLSGIAYKYQKFIYLYPDYTANTTSTFQKVKQIIDYAAKEYSSDPDKIVLTGVSNGAVATFWLGYTYPDYFSAVVPMCGPAYSYGPLSGDIDSKARSISRTNLWSLTAGRGDFGNYEYKSKQLIQKIKSVSPSSKALYACKTDEFSNVIKSELGKSPTNMPSISTYQHCTIMAYYQVPEFWEWMLKQ